MNIQTEISQILEEIEGLSPAGYAMAFHINFTTPDFLFQTYVEDWTNEYNQNGFLMQDPTVRWGFENTGTIRWSDLADQDEAGVLLKARDHGIIYGFTYVLEVNESRSLCSFARADAEFTDAEIAEICPLVDSLHDATANSGPLNEKTRAELKRLSVRFTHPGTRQS